MKKFLPLVVCTIVALVAGIALQRCVLSQCSSPPVEGDIDPATVQVRAEWASTEADGNAGVLVLEQDGQTVETLPLGSIWMDDWLDVPIHYTAFRSSRSWWLAWRASGNANMIQHNGAVVWFPEGSTPAVWRGTWERTENRAGDEAYQYHYRSEIIPAPGRAGNLGMRIRTNGRTHDDSQVVFVVLCMAQKQADGSWRFVADEKNALLIEKMLEVKYFAGIHDQLRAFLPAD
jgi:hypothetical protein